MTVLSAANLADYEDLYDLKNYELNGAKFNAALMDWRQNNLYSEVLRGTVLSLLQTDVGRRLTTSELSTLLGKHAEAINQKVNFVIDNAPSKLHEEIMASRQIVSQLHSNYVPNGLPGGLITS